MPDYPTILTALILDRPMCEVCLTDKSGLRSADVARFLGLIRTALKLHEAVGRCRTCGASTRVLSLYRPAA